MNKEQKESFDKWLKTRPQSVQDLAAKYPPGIYKMKAGAPYGISCEGTLVHLISYIENGEIGVAVMAADKLPMAIEHEKVLCKKHGKDPETIHKQNVSVQVDPQWMDWYCEFPKNV